MVLLYTVNEGLGPFPLYISKVRIPKFNKYYY